MNGKTAVRRGRIPGRKPDQVRTSLVTAANELFEAKSFEASTTTEIAARAGVSQRTFFRYFSCKEEVVLEWLDAYFLAISDRLRERPADEPLLESLRRALDAFCTLSDSEIERVEFLQKLSAASGTLRARLLDKLAEWESSVAEELERRGLDAVRAAFLANFTIGIIAVTTRDRSIRGDDVIARLMDIGFEVLKGGHGGET